jgi:SAM-dependent methyltransferase
MLKRDNWFLNYQDTNDGKKGQRVLEYRTPFFDISDFNNKTVLDIGCNLGQMCDYAVKCNAKSVVGIEYDKTVVDLAKKRNKHDNIKYICDDIDNYFLYTNMDETFDTILLLSVIETKELTNSMGMLSKLSNRCQTMYLEGHVNSKYENLMSYLLKYTDFTNIEFKGFQYDNKELQNKDLKRHIFRCSKFCYSFDNVIEKIYSLMSENINHKIAISGKGGVRKTTLRKNLLIFLNKNGFNFDLENIDTENNIMFHDKINNTIIIDDIVGEKCIDFIENKKIKIIYFDYRSIEYMKNYTTTVFYIKSSSNSTITRPYEYSLLRSPHDDMYSVSNIYHVNNW